MPNRRVEGDEADSRSLLRYKFHDDGSLHPLNAGQVFMMSNIKNKIGNIAENSLSFRKLHRVFSGQVLRLYFWIFVFRVRRVIMISFPADHRVSRFLFDFFDCIIKLHLFTQLVRCAIIHPSTKSHQKQYVKIAKSVE